MLDASLTKVHYRDRASRAPMCNPGLKGKSGHVMAKTWGDLEGEDGAPLTGERSGCLDCLKMRASKAAPAPASEPSAPDGTAELLKIQLRSIAPPMANSVLFGYDRPPLPDPAGVAALSGVTDSAVDVLEHYGLLGMVASPQVTLGVNILLFWLVVRGLPVLEGNELLEAHGMPTAPDGAALAPPDVPEATPYPYPEAGEWEASGDEATA